MSNDESGTIRIDLCTPIEEFEGGLEAIQDDNGLAEGIQVHYVFWGLSESEIGENRNELTELSFALLPEHPKLILELKGISEDGKTPWAGGNSAPWAPCVPDCKDENDTRN
jgi:hypothetical protein